MRLKSEIVYSVAIDIDGNQVINDNGIIVIPPDHLSKWEKAAWLKQSINNGFYVFDVEIHLNGNIIASTSPDFEIKPASGLIRSLTKKRVDYTLAVFNLTQGVVTVDGEEMPDGIPCIKPALNKDGELSTVPYLEFNKSNESVDVDEMIELMQMYNVLLSQCITESEPCNVSDLLKEFLLDVGIII